MTFDVVGTLIDFEGGLKSCLQEVAIEAGVEIDGEEALSLYRAARYSDDAVLFPDDLVRVYLDIAPHWALFPGGAIFITVLAINFMGDGLRDALDPRRVL